MASLHSSRLALVLAIAALHVAAVAAENPLSSGGARVPPLRFLRVTPDPGVVFQAPLLAVKLEFNQPVQEGFGDLTIVCGERSYSGSVRGPHVWVGNGPSQAGGATVSFFFQEVPLGECTASVPAGAMVGALAGSPSPSKQWSFTVGQLPRPSPALPAVLAQHHLPRLDQARMNQTMAHLSFDYENRFSMSASGRASAEWLAQQYERIAQEEGRSDVQVESFAHAWQMPSIVVRVPGSEAPGETVIVGAHLDTINWQNITTNLWTGRAPGANDDGSAISLQLEVFRQLLAGGFRPRRTVELHAYSGEEEGLYGSADVAAAYARNGRDVFAMLQLDQCGLVLDPAKPRIAVYTDNTHPELSVFVTKLIDAYCSTPWEWSNEQKRADSDFHSWTNHGFAAAYAAEGPVDDIVYGNNKHTPGDVLSGVNLPHVMEFGRLAMGFVLELAGPADSVLYA